MWTIRVFASLSRSPRSPKGGELGNDIARQDLMRQCCYHQIVGITDQADAAVVAAALAWSDVSTLIVLGPEEPLHAVERHIRQQRRERATLRCSCRCWFPCAQFHGAGRQPAPDYGGEHR